MHNIVQDYYGRKLERSEDLKNKCLAVIQTSYQHG